MIDLNIIETKLTSFSFHSSWINSCWVFSLFLDLEFLDLNPDLFSLFFLFLPLVCFIGILLLWLTAGWVSNRLEYFYARLLFDLPESMFDWDGVIWTMWWFGLVLWRLVSWRFRTGMVKSLWRFGLLVFSSIWLVFSFEMLCGRSSLASFSSKSWTFVAAKPLWFCTRSWGPTTTRLPTHFIWPFGLAVSTMLMSLLGFDFEL